MPSTDPLRRVYLHIGAPKAGSTFLQETLWANRPALQQAGVALPGVGSFEHYRASKDLRGDAFDAREPGGDGSGAWDVLARKVRDRREPLVVLSDELLAGLSDEQIRRAIRSLAPREVHTIFVMRGVESLLPSYWQEVVKHGGRRPYAKWARTVINDPDRPFWRLEDASSVVDRWGAFVPPERQHVVTLPRGNADRAELWRRFSTIIGVNELPVAFPELPSNRSLGQAETELLRQVNVELDGSLERWHRGSLVLDVLVERVLSTASGSTVSTLPVDLREKLDARQGQIAEALERSGCDMIGSFEDLLPHDEPRGAQPPDDAELLAAAVHTIAGLLNEMAEQQQVARNTPRARLLAAVLRRRSVVRVLGAVEGRSTRLDRYVAQQAAQAREVLRGHR